MIFLTDLFPKGDEATQREVIALLGRIGDLRGVPTLIAALDSPHQWVALEAARATELSLSRCPRRDRGVSSSAAVPDPPQNEHLKNSAERYLMAYDSSLAAQIEARRNAYQKASERLQSGDEAGARPFFDLILKDPAQTESFVRFSSDWIVRIIQQ